MSKKNKAKFKRQLKNQIIQELNKTNNVSTNETKPAKNDIIEQTKSKAVSQNESSLSDTTQIKNDLIKTIIVVIIIAGVITALAVLDQKNNILADFGKMIFRVLNIN